MMNEAIKSFPAQFSFAPEIERKEKLGTYKQYVVLGMGGSHLAADMLSGREPSLRMVVHSDYGLPHIAEEEKAKTLIIASSYSGNTEETLDGFEEAGRRGIPRSAISAGGRLRDLARNACVPYIQLPDTGVQPRSATGFSIIAMAVLMRQDTVAEELRGIGDWLAQHMNAFESQGKILAEQARGRTPVIYASSRNRAVAYNWKIKLNETGKVPAFYNVIPELNHNEMTGFDMTDTTRTLSEKMFFVFLEDADDHPKNQKCMAVTAGLYRDRGLPVVSVRALGTQPFEKMFASTLIADWFAYYTSREYGTEAEQVPMVEEFKKKIA
ncbi:MAG: SIS domain-containing protein [Patescibacteria group bacterium]